MFPLREDLIRVAPELVACAFGILIMILEPFLRRERKGALATTGLLGTLLSLGAAVWAAQLPGTAFHELIRVDSFSLFLRGLVFGIAALVILGSRDYLGRENVQQGEYYALVLFGAAGMSVMAGANELLTVFLGLEASSLSTYILASFRRNVLRSNEAAMKYFLLGSFATAFFLYGAAMVYGATGTTRLDLVGESVTNTALLTLGLGLVFVGLAFKVATVPFHVWTPDVYEGAPAPVTALLSSGPKAAAFAVLLRVYAAVLDASELWFWAIWISAVLTMFVGNLAALVQTNVKRMLAYSSIAHAGYVLVAFAARNEPGIAAVLFYLVAYALMKIGAFTTVAFLSDRGEQRLTLADYAGLGQRKPIAAALLSLYLLSLLGLPATAGFLGKFYVFQAALDSRLVWLAVLMAINTAIGAYYYLRVIIAMYFEEPREPRTPAQLTPGVSLVLLLTAAGTLVLGVFPKPVMSLAIQAVSSFR